MLLLKNDLIKIKRLHQCDWERKHVTNSVSQGKVSLFSHMVALLSLSNKATSKSHLWDSKQK
jgi:hypothetical protein